MMESRAATAADTKSEKIKSALRHLHADELAYLVQKPAIASIGLDDAYLSYAWTTTKQYWIFLYNTWSRAIWSTIFLPTNIFDRLSIYAFAFFSSLILGSLLIFCLVINLPYIKKAIELWTRKNAHGLTITNASYPYIFHELSNQEVAVARDALAQPISENPNTLLIRYFNLDIAKLLLQCSAIMYEHTSDPLHRALDSTRASREKQHRQLTDPEISVPGQLLSTTVGSDAAQKLRDQLHENNQEESTMSLFASDLGIQYTTISELNTHSSALCGLFWDPNSTYMILAFKGTSPTEFIEWAADFSYVPRHAGHWIRGFGQVHSGFMDRMFPRKVIRGARLPYDTIKEGIKKAASILLTGKPPGTQINVWTTGHSLGTAIASLFYARAINEYKEFGPNIIFRDAYLFATPIICDVQSVHNFHNRMNHDNVRTMWRITNGNDVVAAGLPHSGDHQGWSLSPYNLFSFAHLGTEVKLRSGPDRCLISGNQIPNGSHVRIRSAMTPPTTGGAQLLEEHHPRPNGIGIEEDEPQYLADGTEVRSPDYDWSSGTQLPMLNSNRHQATPEERERLREQLRRWQRLPLIGRLVAHGTVAYWDQLQRVRVGGCEWIEE